MLVSFAVSNFRSFGEEAVLTMVASNKLTAHPSHCVPLADSGKSLLRASVIYGANAAGKSNLIKAMAYGQRLIKERSERTRQTEPFRGARFTEEPSSFEYRFLVGERVFVYGFDVRVDVVESEWLDVVHKGDEIQVFERDKSGDAHVFSAAKRLFFNDSVMFETLEKLSELPCRTDQLFLNRIATGVPQAVQGYTLRSIINWLTEDLVIVPPGAKSPALIEKLADDPFLRDFCARFLANVGTGVGNLRMHEVKRGAYEWEKRYIESYSKSANYRLPAFEEWDVDIRPNPDDPSSVTVRRLIAEHNTPEECFSLPFGSESDGTQALLHLLPVLAQSPATSRVLVIDELDRSLHPLLAWEVIRFFSEATPGARKQLIATTHEAHLLNQELLRRDEYWFAEKDEFQQTRLVSLADFSIRHDLKIEKGYLQGRFGAIPMVGGMHELERLLDCSQAGE